jgi:hypothetical protein
VDRDRVAVILALGFVIALDLIAAAILWVALVGDPPGDDAGRVFAGLMGAVLALLAGVLGFRVGRSKNGD